MGAWIEIALRWCQFNHPLRRPRMGAWIEIVTWQRDIVARTGRPRMGAWIEIVGGGELPRLYLSPPHGGVD